MSDEEEVSGGEEGAGELQDDDVRSISTLPTGIES